MGKGDVVSVKEKKISMYALITKHGISKGTIHRMRHNFSLSTRTIHDLYRIIKCNVQDIMTYIDEGRISFIKK